MLGSATILLLTLTLAGAVWALDRIDPVPSRKPASDAVKQAFDEVFGADLKAAQAKSDTAALGLLAVKIRGEADNRMNSSGEFAAYALDQVVAVASPLAGRQRLVYDALATQKSAGLRPARACLEKMVQLGPRVAAELNGKSRDNWTTKNWLTDALALAKMEMGENHYALACAALAPLKEPLKESNAPALAEFRQILTDTEFLREVEEAGQKFEAELKTPGAHLEANLALAAIKISRDRKPAEAAPLLKASGDPAAENLATILESGHELAGKDELAAAVALAALAPKAPGTYFQYLLWHEEYAHLEHVTSNPGLSDDEMARAEKLKDEVIDKMAAIATALPARLVDAVRPKSICFVVQKSGCMTDCMIGVKAWLTLAIHEVKPSASFYINFFTNTSQELPVHGFLPGTAANKRLAYDLIKVIKAGGEHKPEEALKHAFDLQPDIIYLVVQDTDQSFPELVARLNAKKKVVINTICIVYNIDEPMLKQMAKENRGVYKFIDENEFEKLEKAAEEAVKKDK
jgi:hypothetical protein